MADKATVPLDVAHQALELAEVRKNHELLQQRVSHGMENVTSTMAGVSNNVVKLVNQIEGLSRLQHTHEANREAIADLRLTINGMETNLKSWLEDVNDANNQKWQNYEHNRDMWRQQHEAENEDAIRGVLSEVRTLRENWIRTVGWGGGAGVLVSVVVGGFLFWMNQKFEDNAAKSRANLTLIEQNRARIETEKDKRHEMELYLARGGRVPEHPYQPSKENTR